MRITSNLIDDAVLEELGTRLAQRRIAHGLTQAQAANKAGISSRTIARIETGESAQLSSFIRLLRALDLLAGFETLVPPAQASPMELLRHQRKPRKRASRSTPKPDSDWTWGEDE